MSFWSSNTLEPLRKFRFQIQFGDEIVWWAKSVTQPSPDVSMGEYQLVNHKVKYPGIVTWNDIDITIVDIEGTDKGEIKNFLYGQDSPSKGLQYMSLLETNGYNPTVSSSKEDGLNKKVFSGKDILITKINSEGKVLDTWELINPFIKSIKYGDLDYSSDDLLEITITVAYDSATLT